MLAKAYGEQPWRQDKGCSSLTSSRATAASTLLHLRPAPLTLRLGLGRSFACIGHARTPIRPAAPLILTISVKLAAQTFATCPSLMTTSLFVPPKQPSDVPGCDVLFVGGADNERVEFMKGFMCAGPPVALCGAYWEHYPATRSHARGHKGYEGASLLPMPRSICASCAARIATVTSCA